MAKQFTVQKRARMKIVGYATVEKQWAWDASEYIRAPKKFAPAKVARPAPERKTVTIDITPKGKGPSRSLAFLATDWTPEVRLIPAR